MFLSIVIPVYNEEESLEELIRQIEAVCEKENYEKEVIFVDDGSKDTSWEVIRKLAADRPYIHAVRFRRNFGKAAALEAGFAQVKGDFVMTMDADLQDDPAEIPNFLAKMAEGYDVVSGWKKVRHDPWHKVYPSRLFNKTVSWLTGVKLHDHNCGMKCYRGEVLKEVAIYGERHRFIPVLAGARGFRVSEVVIQHRARQFGVSKYGFSRFLKGFMDLLSVKLATTYGQRPLHVLGGTAIILLLIGFMGWLLTDLIFMLSSHFDWKSVSQREEPISVVVNIILYVYFFIRMLLYYAWFFCINFGMLLLTGGIVAELMTAFYQQGPKHAQTNFSVKETI